MIEQNILHAEPQCVIAIGEKIIQKHVSLGTASPLKNIVVADLNARISAARQKHDEGEKYKKLMEEAWRDRDMFLGAREKSVHQALIAICNVLDEEKVNTNDWGFTKL